MFFFSFLKKNGSFGVKFAELGKMTPSTFDPFDLGGEGAWDAGTNMSHPDPS
jgi:hypothetical protein